MPRELPLSSLGKYIPDVERPNSSKRQSCRLRQSELGEEPEVESDALRGSAEAAGKGGRHHSTLAGEQVTGDTNQHLGPGHNKPASQEWMHGARE